MRLPSELGDSLIVVVVVECFPDQRSEDDDDQETPASYRYRPRRRSLSVGNKEIETNDELLPSGGGLAVNLLQPLPRFLV